MIGQCLSNKNESATVSKSKKILDLNKALYSKMNVRAIFIQLNFMLCLCYMFSDCIKISAFSGKNNELQSSQSYKHYLVKYKR